MSFDYNQVSELNKRNDQRKVVYVKSLDNFTPLNNMVLISISPEENELIHGWLHYVDETFLDEKNRYNASEHTIRHGTIVKQPDQYVYHESGQQNHKTSIETKVGDDVYFPASESANCLLIECDGKYYLLMNYEVLYVAKRKTKQFKIDNQIRVGDELFDVIVLNGYLLCKRVYEEPFSASIIAMVDKEVLNLKYADVHFAGTPVEYRQPKITSLPSKRGTAGYPGHCNGYNSPKTFPASNPEVSSCQRIMIDNHKAEVMMESDLHLTFDGVNNYRVVQRRNVIAIL